MKTAIVIDPPDFDERAAWQECRDWVDHHGPDTMAAAFGADPGICSCPSCNEMYWAFGRAQRCVVCGFEYPTDAWAMFSWGTQARWSKERNEGMSKMDADRMWHPYFCYGYENGPDRDESKSLHAWYEEQDWKIIMADYKGHLKHAKPEPRRPSPEIEEVMANFMKAREAIVSHLGGPWKRGVKGEHGVIDCPVCGKKECLAFSRSGYNGHIHAKCGTEGCVAWME